MMIIQEPRRRIARCSPLGKGGAFARPPKILSGAQFVPTSVTGCVLWLRADLGVHIGTGVSQWDDQSGAGNNVTQVTGSKQPTRNASDVAYASQSTLSFATASLQQLASATLGASLSTWTIFIVGNDDASNADYMQDNPGNTWVIRPSGGLYELSGSLNLASSAPLSTSPMVFCVVGAGSGGTSQMYFSARTANVSGNAGVTLLTSFLVGFAAGNNLNGKIAEVIAYNNVIASSDRNAIFTYLGSRYAIAIGA